MKTPVATIRAIVIVLGWSMEEPLNAANPVIAIVLGASAPYTPRALNPGTATVRAVRVPNTPVAAIAGTAIVRGVSAPKTPAAEIPGTAITRGFKAPNTPVAEKPATGTVRAPNAPKTPVAENPDTATVRAARPVNAPVAVKPASETDRAGRVVLAAGAGRLDTGREEPRPPRAVEGNGRAGGVPELGGPYPPVLGGVGCAAATTDGEFATTRMRARYTSRPTPVTSPPISTRSTLFLRSNFIGGGSGRCWTPFVNTRSRSPWNSKTILVSWPTNFPSSSFGICAEYGRLSPPPRIDRPHDVQTS